METKTLLGEGAFYNNQLTSVVIPNYITTIGDLAFAENPLTSVVIEGDVTRFNDRWTNIGFPISQKP